MQTVIDPALAAKAAVHLSKTDATLAPIIAQVGVCTIAAHTDYYRALGSSIIGQQLSVKAAATIRQRFCDLFGGSFPKPEAILEHSIEELRTAGLSRAKAMYIQDLAVHILEGKINFETIDSMENDEIIAMLTDVKGIGTWTVHMFLMFCMGRTDILAVGDLGIRAAIRKLYKLDHLPSPKEIVEVAAKKQWHPYETIACWYLWRSLENEPGVV